MTFIHLTSNAIIPSTTAPTPIMWGPDTSAGTTSAMRKSYQTQCQDMFWDLYIPKGSCAVIDPFILRCKYPANWTVIAQQMSGREKALELAFLALSASRVGHDSKDSRMAQESLKIYGKALRDLQCALWDPSRMHSDEVLMACMFLGLYEVGLVSDGLPRLGLHVPGV
jgi:hypothetical protein